MLVVKRYFDESLTYKESKGLRVSKRFSPPPLNFNSPQYCLSREGIKINSIPLEVYNNQLPATKIIINKKYIRPHNFKREQYIDHAEDALSDTKNIVFSTPAHYKVNTLMSRTDKVLNSSEPVKVLMEVVGSVCYGISNDKPVSDMVLGMTTISTPLRKFEELIYTISSSRVDNDDQQIKYSEEFAGEITNTTSKADIVFIKNINHGVVDEIGVIPSHNMYNSLKTQVYREPIECGIVKQVTYGKITKQHSLDLVDKVFMSEPYIVLSDGSNPVDSTTGNLEDIRLLIQRNLYFKQVLNFKQLSISAVTGLPDGLILKGNTIQGSTSVSGTFNCTIELSDGNVVGLVIVVDRIKRTK